MKGLERIPQDSDLLRAYNALQKNMRSPSFEVPISDIALFSQWSRFDPRLAEQLVSTLAHAWKQINPMALKKELASYPWPRAFAVLCEFAKKYFLTDREEKKDFSLWLALIVNRPDKHVTAEQFFIGTRAFAGRQMLLDAQRSLTPYKKWGYLSREVLLNKDRSRTARHPKTNLAPAVRGLILEEYMQKNRSITVGDYVRLLGGQVSSRQAQRDLNSRKNLKAYGHTQGRIYLRK